MMTPLPPAQTRLDYPSREAPGFTPFTLTYPAGWQPVESSLFLAVIVDPRTVGSFHANIVIGASRLPAATPLLLAAQQTLEQSRSLFPGFAVTREDPVAVGGQPAWLRLQSFWVEEIGGRVGQLQILFFAPPWGGGATKEFFRLHATCHADAINDYVQPFLAVVRSFHFRPHLEDQA